MGLQQSRQRLLLLLLLLACLGSAGILCLERLVRLYAPGGLGTPRTGAPTGQAATLQPQPLVRSGSPSQCLMLISDITTQYTLSGYR